jgi:hypothetical protein
MGAFMYLSRCPGLNWRPSPYHGDALPTELHRQTFTELYTDSVPARIPEISEKINLRDGKVFYPAAGVD